MEDFMVWMYTGHRNIFSKVKGWKGVTIREIFVMVYFMFQGIWIILGGNYFLDKTNNFGGMGGNFISFFYLTLP
jgi:hypothetical protein